VLRLVAAASLVVVLAATGCGSSSSPSTDASPERVRELTSIEGLRESFNDDRGTPRLLLLLSPT